MKKRGEIPALNFDEITAIAYAAAIAATARELALMEQDEAKGAEGLQIVRAVRPYRPQHTTRVSLPLRQTET